ncbi:hypothetical protein E0Z10_g2465 [Xylaria hypoxylon]|uniref:Uncharacterized protein n=1 Tax=Xylaria hypoxylon TaxID=37992 RepID=A0A4Z0Z445_9PEZI|nr:hypothetical protein E0Z10_g2465 [Xylaria hypoxylon]
MPLPTDKTPSSSPALTSSQKKHLRKRKRQMEAQQAGTQDEQDRSPQRKVLKLAPMPKPILFKRDKEATPKQGVAEKKDVDEEPSEDEVKEQIELYILEKKTEELQGYVNQIQDAVTIGMFQLRDLKRKITIAKAVLASADN